MNGLKFQTIFFGVIFKFKEINSIKNRLINTLIKGKLTRSFKKS